MHLVLHEEKSTNRLSANENDEFAMELDDLHYHIFSDRQGSFVKGRQIIAELQSIRLKRLNCGSSEEQEK